MVIFLQIWMCLGLPQPSQVLRGRALGVHQRRLPRARHEAGGGLAPRQAGVQTERLQLEALQGHQQGLHGRWVNR